MVKDSKTTMTRRKVTYYQVFCDYPEHTPVENTELAKGKVYHLIGGNLVVCNECWENKLVVEHLLRLLSVTYDVTNVGKE